MQRVILILLRRPYVATGPLKSRRKCGQCPHPLWLDKESTSGSHDVHQEPSKKFRTKAGNVMLYPSSQTYCRVRLILAQCSG
jgi:hypothetical protein